MNVFWIQPIIYSSILEKVLAGADRSSAGRGEERAILEREGAVAFPSLGSSPEGVTSQNKVSLFSRWKASTHKMHPITNIFN